MTSAPLILVCDHRGEGLWQRLGSLSAEGVPLELARNLRQTLTMLPDRRPSVVVIDPLVSGGGVELEELERVRPKDPPTPVLVVAGDADASQAVRTAGTLEQGLWDVVRRDAPIEEYLMRVEQLRGRAEGHVEMEILRHRATHDDRTDLLRGGFFEERLREHFSAAQRHGHSLALMLLDMDRFGQINKLFDHTVGDRLITRVAMVIRRALRAEDVAGRLEEIAGRLGGDEFAVLLPYTSKVDTARVVQRLLEEIAQLSGRIAGAGRAEVSVSIGFETFDGGDLDGVETLRRHAEVALRHAKEGGGNAGVYFRNLPEDVQAAADRPPGADG